MKHLDVAVAGGGASGHTILHSLGTWLSGAWGKCVQLRGLRALRAGAGHVYTIWAPSPRLHLTVLSTCVFRWQERAQQAAEQQGGLGSHALLRHLLYEGGTREAGEDEEEPAPEHERDSGPQDSTDGARWRQVLEDLRRQVRKEPRCCCVGRDGVGLWSLCPVG